MIALAKEPVKSGICDFFHNMLDKSASCTDHISGVSFDAVKEISIMRQMIIYGRGGQGVMVAAEVLATALWSQGKFIQAFPSFQPEKKGAPTAAYLRYDDEEIWLRSEIDSANVVLVLDSSAISPSEASSRLLPGGLLISNGPLPSPSSQQLADYRWAEVKANQIAIRHKLGSRLTPQVNILMLAAFARLSSDPPLAAIENAIALTKVELTDNLRLAIHEAYEHVSEVLT
jgi:pyruvate ferredoxin oxidoreductase gamma subunit